MFSRRKKKTLAPRDAAREAEAGTLQLVDVREPAEVAESRIPHARNIPLADLPRRLHELDRTRRVAFLCRSGVRSRMAMKLARDHGIDAVNVAGGVIAWRREAAVEA